MKSQKESQNSRNQVFFKLFLHDDRRIRIRILDAQKHVDPVHSDPDSPDSDLDPQHCFFPSKPNNTVQNLLWILLQVIHFTKAQTQEFDFRDRTKGLSSSFFSVLVTSQRKKNSKSYGVGGGGFFMCHCHHDPSLIII
jgi:hypothetical protein